jgi:hypothetical protein
VNRILLVFAQNEPAKEAKEKGKCTRPSSQWSETIAPVVEVPLVARQRYATFGPTDLKPFGISAPGVEYSGGTARRVRCAHDR